MKPATGRTHWAKGLWIVADVVVIGGILGSAWWHWQNAVPDIAIPAPAPLPSPNGYDLLRQASGMIHETETMDRALSRTRVQNGNVSDGTTPPDPARVAADIAANTPALRLARQSLQVAFRNPPSRSFTTKFPDLAHFRAVARVLSVEGSVHETNGEYGAAAQSRLDAMQLGADQIPNGGVLIHYLVGVACEAIGRRPLWSLAGKLSADDGSLNMLLVQLRGAAKRVESALDDAKLGTTTASLRETSDSVGRAATDVGDVRHELRDALVALRETLESIRALADAIERDPSILVRGPRADGQPGAAQNR